MPQILENKKMLAIILGVLVVLAVGAYLFLQGAPGGSKEITEGQLVVVTVSAASLDKMFAYQFNMNYNAEEFEYVENSLTSKNTISMIFAKAFTGYQLVGATMVGEATGISGKNQDVCEMSFIAKKSGDTANMSLSISDVKVVRDDLEYNENVDDWSITITTRDIPLESQADQESQAA